VAQSSVNTEWQELDKTKNKYNQTKYWNALSEKEN
jgi:hypothetical protein